MNDNPLQVKIYSDSSYTALERAINIDLKATSVEIVDIKYSGTGWHKLLEGTREYSAMVIYRCK